jgi:outer membrane protein assembly factor BamB
VGDYLYGHSDKGGWTCLSFADGSVKWRGKGLGKGAVGYADGMLYCLEESSGNVVLAPASPDGWNPKGKFKLEPQSAHRNPQGRIWVHPVIANGKLYLRDQEFVYCYDVKQ